MMLFGFLQSDPGRIVGSTLVEDALLLLTELGPLFSCSQLWSIKGFLRRIRIQGIIRSPALTVKLNLLGVDAH